MCPGVTGNCVDERFETTARLAVSGPVLKTTRSITSFIGTLFFVLMMLTLFFASTVRANDLQLQFEAQSPANTVPAGQSVTYSLVTQNVTDGVNNPSTIGVGIAIKVNGNTVQANSGAFTTTACRVDPQFPFAFACNDLAESNSQTPTFTWNNPLPGTSTIEFVGTCQLVPKQNPAAFCTSSGTTISVQTIVVSVPSALTKVGGEGQLPLPGATLNPFVVAVVDANGSPIAGVSINWTVSSGTGSLTSGTTSTGSDGRASNTLTLNPNASGGVSVTAAITGGPQVVFTAEITPPTLGKISGDAQSPLPGATLNPFVVALVDGNGSPVGSTAITWTVSPVGAGSLTSGTTSTGSDGRASNTLTLGTNASGAVTITATAAGGAQVVFAVNSTQPALGKISGDAQSPLPGAALDPFVVALADGSGSPIAGTTITWTVEPAGAGSLVNGTTTTGSDGRTSNTLTLDANASGAITVTAAAAGGIQVVFTANSTKPALGKVGGDSQLASPGDTLDPFVVALADGSGSPIAGTTIIWTVEPAGAGSLINGTTTTGSDGRTSNTLTLDASASGAVTVTAAAAGGAQVVFTTNSTNFSDMPGLSDNEKGAAQALANTCEALQGGSQGLEALAAACSTTGAEAVAMIGQITPAQIASQGNSSVEIQNTQFTNISTRMTQLRGGATGASANGLTLNFDGKYRTLFNKGSAYLLSNATGGAASADEPSPLGRLGVFINGSGSFGDTDTTSKQLGFDFDTAGVTAGADYRITDTLVLGGALGYVSSNYDFDNSQGDQDITGYTVSAFGTWYKSERIYVDGILSYGWNEFDIKRRIRFGTTDVTAKGSPDGTELAASIGAGYDFDRGALSFGPYGRVNYIKAEIDSYNEGPAGGLEQSYDDQDVDSLTTLLGGQVSYAISTRRGVFSPQLRFEWAHEFEDNSQNITARFLNDPTSGTFNVSTEDPDRDYFNLGLGISAVFATGRSAFIYYQTSVGRDNITENSIAGGLRFEF